MSHDHLYRYIFSHTKKTYLYFEIMFVDQVDKFCFGLRNATEMYVQWKLIV